MYLATKQAIVALAVGIFKIFTHQFTTADTNKKFVDHKEKMSAKPAPLVEGVDQNKLHQLKRTWGFYYLIPNRQGSPTCDWETFLEPLHAIHYFEDFFAIQNTIVPAKELPKGCRYYVFAEDNGVPIKPLWEDEHNWGGWELFVEFQVPQDQKGRRSSNKNAEAEEQFTDLCCRVLGASNEIRHTEFITGIEFNCRGPVIKVGVWLGNAVNQKEGAMKQIKEDLEKAMKCHVKELKISQDRMPSENKAGKSENKPGRSESKPERNSSHRTRRGDSDRNGRTPSGKTGDKSPLAQTH